MRRIIYELKIEINSTALDRMTLFLCNISSSLSSTLGRIDRGIPERTENK